MNPRAANVWRTVRSDPKRWTSYPVGALWMFWGSLHFLSARGAQLQLAWLPDPFPAIGIATTGILELLVAMMVFFPRWRRIAALGQFVLLIVFLAPLVYMMINDDAIATLFGHFKDYRWLRFLTVLHNVMLFLWALWILEPDGGMSLEWPQLEADSPVIIVSLILLAANVAGFGVIAAGPWQMTMPSLWGMACLAVGGLVGFIFGVPRVDPSSSTPTGCRLAVSRYRPNANIEVLSDWLTKILVGVGLVEATRLTHFVGTASRYVSAGFVARTPNDPIALDANAFAAGIIVFFFSAGIIEGYLLTRMYLGRAFEIEDVGRIET